jgi:glutathione S-transferase
VKLYGSIPSPYVRRIRLFLEGRDYQFINLDIFADEDRKLLTDANPAQKIPALIDGEDCIYDSGVIYRYLTEKFQLPKLTWEQENLLTLIDAVNDSLVSMLIMKRSGFDIEQDKFFFNLQRERCQKVLTVLEGEVKKGRFNQWNYLTIALYSLLDWIQFRVLYDLTPYSALVEFINNFSNKDIVKLTDPRLADS